MKMLSINFGHDASFCVFRDGALIDFCEVERESRMRHHFGLTSDTILRYLQRLNMELDSFDLVLVSGTQQWGVFHSGDISIKYGYSSGHAKFCEQQSHWAPENYLFFDGVTAGFTPHVQRSRFSASPTPMRTEWGPAFRSISSNFKNIAGLANDFVQAAADTKIQLQSRFLTPLLLTIGKVTRPGFFVDHHAAHANYAGYYGGANAIVVTHDGGLVTAPFNSGGIYLFDKASGVLPFASHRLVLGNVYDLVSRRFGIDPGKLMGLASYGRANRHADAVIRQYTENLHAQDTLPSQYVASLIVEGATLDQVLRPKAVDKFRFGFKDVPHAVQAAANAQHFVQHVYVDQIGSYCEKLSLSLEAYSSVFMTGGFSLNCPTNTAISSSYPSLSFRPLPGVADTGLSLGAAVAAHYFLRIPLQFNCSQGPMAPAFPPSCLDHNALDKSAPGLVSVDVPPKDRTKFIADNLLQGKIFCIHRGRSEVGPRALGRRSIIAWAGMEENRDRINRSKRREGWRPLAPICAIGDFHDYFVGDPEECRFMLTTSKIKSQAIPAVTHVDNTARVQVIDEEDALLFDILSRIKSQGFAPVIVNTSFNCAGEPLVETLTDAARAFAKMSLDYLVSETGIFRLAQAGDPGTTEANASGSRVFKELGSD
jgi:carbamoyltransferase